MYDILRILRNAQALTQENVANALHIGKSTYAKIEQGTNSLSIQYIEPLAQILGVNSRDLFELYISPNNTLADNRPLTMIIVKYVLIMTIVMKNINYALFFEILIINFFVEYYTAVA